MLKKKNKMIKIGNKHFMGQFYRRPLSIDIFQSQVMIGEPGVESIKDRFPVKLDLVSSSAHIFRYNFEPESLNRSRGALLKNEEGETTVVFGHLKNVSISEF